MIDLSTSLSMFGLGGTKGRVARGGYANPIFADTENENRFCHRRSYYSLVILSGHTLLDRAGCDLLL